MGIKFTREVQDFVRELEELNPVQQTCQIADWFENRGIDCSTEAFRTITSGTIRYDLNSQQISMSGATPNPKLIGFCIFDFLACGYWSLWNSKLRKDLNQRRSKGETITAADLVTSGVQVDISELATLICKIG
jgi:hypothetical protein